VALPVSFPFVDTPSFYSGTATSALVPEVFPVAINGRPYMVDVKSQQFTRQFDPRVRDSQDTSTAPGESAINPQGLWRRGEVSWHLGAGQRYSDTAEGQDYRFWQSKGVNPWTRGRLTLLNATKRSLESANTNLPMVEVNGYVYVGDGQTLKYSNNPFAATPTWTSVTSGAPTATINDLTTDGVRIYVAYANNSIYITTPGGASVTQHFLSSTNVNFTRLGFAKGFVMSYHPDTVDSHIHVVPWEASNTKTTVTATLRDPNFVCAGFAGGQNHIYVAGRSSDTGIIYRLGIKADGTVDVAIVALELPIGEYPTSIFGYLGAILIGTNKGVRYSSPDNQGNLVAGALIPTPGDVQGFTAEDRFVWFGWSNYDASSTGLGRLDLSSFIAGNTPAHASDLMYTSGNTVKATVSLANKRIFTVAGVGVVVEDADILVASGSVTTGIYRWGIPDDKFAPRVDVRTEPLKGNVLAEVAVENQDFVDIGIFNAQNQTRHTYIAPENKFIEAAYRFTLEPSDTNISPILTRWMSRAYAAPARSRIISVPILLHERFNINNKDYYFDVALERDLLEELAASPRIVTYQEKDDTFSVIVEDARWQPVLVSGTDWLWEGTMTLIMRTITE
jgi:hypothetical protein